MAGQLTQRSPNRWKVQVFLGRNANGKRQFFTKTIQGNKKAAQEFLTEKLREKDLGHLVIDADSSTLDEYLDRWLQAAAKPRVRLRTHYEYQQLLRRYVRPALGSRKLSSITPLDIQTLYSRLLEKGLSARTVRYLHNVLSSALKQAVKWRLVTQNPAVFVDLPRQQRKEMHALDAAQAKAFLDAAKNKSCEPMFALALTTGMGPGEYLALQWKDIDFQKATVTVQRTLSRHKGDWHFDEPKTPRRRRSIPIPPQVVTLLQEHERKQAEYRITHADIYDDLDLVFATANGSPYSIRNVLDDFFKPLLKDAKLPDIRLYDLRHTCATLLLLHGENPKVVSERLGHASVMLTLDTYSHVLPTMQKSATKKLEALLFKKPRRQTNSVR
jgi:integrase